MINVQENTNTTGIVLEQGRWCIEIPTEDIMSTVEKMLKSYVELTEGKKRA